MLKKEPIPTRSAMLTSTLRSQYRLIQQLGEGGNGIVFKAVQQNTGQLVALKLMHLKESITEGLGGRNFDKTECMALRFEREVSLCAQLHHPHIVNLLDKGQALNGQLFAVFEFIPGETLRDSLIRKGRFSAFETGELMGQILDALVCVHALGIVHLDLKPNNIMITTSGKHNHAKILDFGIACLIPDQNEADYRDSSLPRETLCSPAYSAPEQLRGAPPSVKMDLYAWGLLCLECLTGRPAIAGATVAEIFHKQLNSMEVPIPAFLLSHPLGQLLRRVLNKKAHERIGDTGKLYRDFKKLNLDTLAGDISEVTAPSGISCDLRLDRTQEYIPGWFVTKHEHPQIAAMCCSLTVGISGAIADATLNDSYIDLL